MDRLIQRFDAQPDGDLMICEHRGVAYQLDMKITAKYDAAYLAKCAAYDPAIEARVIAGRCEMLRRVLPVEAKLKLIDVGAGSGAFLKAAQVMGLDAYGYDVIPEVVLVLQRQERYSADFGAADAITFWDSMEHMDAPEVVLRRVRRGAHVFVSLPIFEDLRAVRDSKHYRPGEHLYYWTVNGFVEWMSFYGYRLLEVSEHENDAGREGIGSFAFCRDLPDYREHIGAYQELHATRHYGDSASEFHLDDAALIVNAVNPLSILDYGCGRSDLVAHFWRDGRRRIERYDPALPRFSEMPKGRFDLVFCCDVLEHIPFASVDKVLFEIKEKTGVVFFTISTKLAKARLPDGRNAHITLLTKSEWTRWILARFGSVQELPTKWEHELVLLAGWKKQIAFNSGKGNGK